MSRTSGYGATRDTEEVRKEEHHAEISFWRNFRAACQPRCMSLDLVPFYAHSSQPWLSSFLVSSDFSGGLQLILLSSISSRKLQKGIARCCCSQWLRFSL